jgi:tetratricopeptide (TPR) repeat protein
MRAPGEAAIPGEELFYEHVHMTFHGNYIVARTLLEKLHDLLPASVGGDSAAPVPLSEEDCEVQLAYTAHDRYKHMLNMRDRVKNAPFANQLGHEARAQRMDAQLERLGAALKAEGPDRAIAQYRIALDAYPDDWMLYENLADILEQYGREEEAVDAWRKVAERLPNHVDAHNAIGLHLARLGDQQGAIKAYQTALRVDPLEEDSLNNLGNAYSREGDYTNALKCYLKSVELDPEFFMARANLGVTYAQIGRFRKALPHLEKAAELNPNDDKVRAALQDLREKTGVSPSS